MTIACVPDVEIGRARILSAHADPSRCSCARARRQRDAVRARQRQPRRQRRRGGERCGLANDDVYRCHACLSIPTAPGYGSLNLAQAVQVIAYEWRQALGGFAVSARTPPQQLADAADVQATLAHWREALLAIG